MKKKLIGAAGMYFAVMLIFTILSRAADSVNVIQIQVKNPQNQMVTHEVTGTGKVEGSQEMAVFVQENLQVEQVLVHAGETVKKGDALMKLSGESISSAAKELENKIKTLEGQVRDLESQKSVDNQKRASEQSWAENSYALAAQSGNVSVDNARAEVNVARQRLEEFYQEKEAAAQEKNEMAGFTSGDTGEAADETGELEPSENSFESGGKTEIILEEAQQDDTDYSIATQSGNEILDGSSQLSDNGEFEESFGEPANLDLEASFSQADDSASNDSAVQLESSGTSSSSDAASTQDDSATEKALQDDLRGKQEALNEVIAGRNQTLASAGKNISDANAPQASDSTLENTKRELENTKEDLEKVTLLQDTGGIITSPSDSVLKSLSVQTGDITGQGAAAVLYLLDDDFRMTGSISKENLKYIDTDMDVQIKDNNNNDISGATVEGITEDENDPDIRNLSILLPKGSLSIGQTAQFSISKDAGPYDCCVPLTALYEENGQNYVYVTDTENTVLGTVLVARQVSVTVKDKNQTIAALESGSISSGQQVIISANRELKDGSRVRLVED